MQIECRTGNNLEDCCRIFVFHLEKTFVSVDEKRQHLDLSQIVLALLHQYFLTNLCGPTAQGAR